MREGSEEYRTFKEEINKEGFEKEEGEEAGGAAVFVGSKEEVEKDRSVAETEGRAVDLETYLRRHKEILATTEEVEEAREEFEGMLKKDKRGKSSVENKAEITRYFMTLKKGDVLNLWPDVDRKKGAILRFKDNLDNLAKVKINFEKIEENIDFEDLSQQLEEKGFRFGYECAIETAAEIEKILRERRAEKLKEEKKSRDFNF